MSRFNLVCHGMMVFQERQNDFLILMPEIKEHEYRTGQPTNQDGKCMKGDNIEDLQMLSPNGIDYTLTGPPGRLGGDLLRQGIISPKDYLIIDGSQASTVFSLKRIALSVPKPDQILLLRELKTGTGQKPDILNGTTSAIVLGVPDRTFEVVVFSYTNVPSGRNISLGSTIPAVTAGDLPVNLCLYAQADKANTPPMPGMPFRHRTGVNDLIHCSSDSGHPTFELSAVGNPDFPPVAPDASVGLGPCDLYSLYELLNARCDISGCSGAAVAR